MRVARDESAFDPASDRGPSLRATPLPAAAAGGSWRRAPVWRVADAVQAAVWKRDDYSCAYCGFRALRYQEVLVEGGNPRDPDRMLTVCMFCHQCRHLERAASMQSGRLVWLPELSQIELNHVAREIYLALLGRTHQQRARRVLDALLERAGIARERAGTSDPAEFANRLRSEAQPDAAVLDGLRLLPLDRHILRIDELEFNLFPQVLAYWRSDEGPYGAATVAAQTFALLEFAERRLSLAPAEPPDAVEPAPVTTNADASAKLLRDAATFFRNIGESNPALTDQMASNAGVFEQVSGLLERDPLDVMTMTDDAGAPQEITIAALAARLLGDAATFFEAVGDQNAPLAEQMQENAEVFRAVAERLLDDPRATLEGT